jgi:hypothetical protein
MTKLPEPCLCGADDCVACRGAAYVKQWKFDQELEAQEVELSTLLAMDSTAPQFCDAFSAMPEEWQNARIAEMALHALEQRDKMLEENSNE